MTFALFEGLSIEVIIQILQYCSYKAILHFGLTCRRHGEIISNSVSLRLRIELGVNGLEIIEGSAKKGVITTSLAILEELNRYRNAWLKPDLTVPAERAVGHPKVLRWELHDGFYFKAYSSFVPQDYPDSLQIIPLDLRLPPPPINFGSKFHKFAVDPSQDLVILVAAIPEQPSHVQLRIRSLNSGQPHPQARYPDLTIEFDFKVSVHSDSTICYAPEISESVLAIRFDSEINRMYEILTWNWMSGRFLHRISSRIGTCACRFIDSSHLAIFSASLPCSGGRLLQDVALSLYDISIHTEFGAEAGSNFCITDYPLLDPVIVFNFPKMRISHSIFSIGLMARSDPVPHRAIYVNSVSFAYSRTITLGLSLSLFQHPTAQGNLGGIRNFQGFVSTSHLLEHLDRHRNSYRRPTVLPWDQWGEQATRWFPENEVDLSCSHMSGSRYVTVKRATNNLPGYHHLVIADFNAPIVQRHQDSDHLRTPYSYKFARQGDNVTLLNMDGPTSNTRSSPPTDGPVSENTVIIITLGRDMPGTFDVGFEETIVSRLPCRVVIRAKPEIQHDGWFLDGHRLVGIKNYFGEHPSLSIYNLEIPA